MTEKHFVEKIAKSTKQKSIDVLVTIRAAKDIIKQELVAGGFVDLYKLGKFYVVRSVERVRRNPQTGENFNAPSKNVPKFKASRALKDVVNGVVPVNVAAEEDGEDEE